LPEGKETDHLYVLSPKEKFNNQKEECRIEECMYNPCRWFLLSKPSTILFDSGSYSPQTPRLPLVVSVRNPSPILLPYHRMTGQSPP
jgi:hypothetical protein